MDTEEFKRRAGQMEYIAAGSEMHLLMHRAAAEAQRITAVINGGFHAQEELRALFSQLIGREVGEGFALFPPFYTDFGKNIAVGRGVFINAGCCFQDQGGIEIGDGCLIGHQVVIATLDHDLDPANRKSMRPAPVRLGRNVWVGSHATILPGVSVGDDAVIAAGAVVTKDVPAATVAAGVPARIVKKI